MSEPGADRRANSAWAMLKPGWLRRSVSLQTILVALVAVGAAVAIFVAIGGVDISADRPDGWLTSHALHFVFKRSVAARANQVTAPGDLGSPSRVHLAAQHFDMVCANCHGRPGFGQSVTALSMNPRPQYLPKVVGQFTDAELYAVVEHGVKYSAMPAWPSDTRGDEVWSMVAFLRQLPKLDAGAYREMTALPTNPATITADDDVTLRPANARRNTEPVDEFLYAAPASGFADGTIHQAPVATCTRCHGTDGSGAATGGEAPNLTIQDPAYLRAALVAYVSGARKSGYMQTIAAQLSGAQITALADHYASLPVRTVAAPPASPALVSRGETIALQGLRERALPACASCHEGPGARITGAPHIAGQSAAFLRRQLGAMSQGGRGSTVPWNPMSAVAHELEDRDIAALAAYYSGLKPAKAGGEQLSRPHPPAAPIDLAAARATFGEVCLKCHVNGGRGDVEGDFPNLTLQNSTFAAQSLYAFRAHARPNGKMQQVTNGLTLDQMTGLAAYIDRLTPRPGLGKPDPTAALRGEAIATKGALARGVPACLSCHDAKAIAALPLIPPLQGQHPAYLRRRLDNFARLYDVNRSTLNPMPAISRRLTDQERADLAAYFAAAPLLRKPAPGP